MAKKECVVGNKSAPYMNILLYILFSSVFRQLLKGSIPDYSSMLGVFCFIAT
jgi:hypothetical protein